MQKWMVMAKRADFAGIAARFHIDPVTARLIRNRGVVGDAAIETYLHGGRQDMHSPWLLKDMDRITRILHEKAAEGKRIRIIGDYDIDGIMSTYILLVGLRRAGVAADYRIPHRIRDGYGISERLIREAFEDGVDTILTCDNGIAAYEQVKCAKELGMTVLITDHHEVPFEEGESGRREILPPADAIVNPRQRECAYPFDGLCGAVVALKVMEAFAGTEGTAGDIVGDFLEFAAIATIGDVMELKGENRIIVREGLEKLHHTENAGLLALINACGLTPEQVGTYHIGYVLGPCLNAAGRLDCAARALRLLDADTAQEAARLAGDLRAMNESRKEMTARGVEQAVRMVETTDLLRDPVLVLFLPECHESLAGIIAGRIREKYYRPTFVLTRTEKGVKGSGRSIETYSMYEKLCECREYLTKFGGHPMAAGISLAEGDVDPFRRVINARCGLAREDLTEKVMIDVPMPISYIRPDLVREFELLAPFGKGNEKPVFAQSGLRVLHPCIFGKNRNVVRMQLADETGYALDAIYFGDGDAFLRETENAPSLAVLYYPEIDGWMGKERLQVVVRGYMT